MAMHSRSSGSVGIVNEDNRGFSSYFFSPVKHPNDYCVLPNEMITNWWYRSERLLLLFALICVAVFISLATPAALMQDFIYNYFYDNAQNRKSNWRYFIWAVVFSLALLSLFVILVQMVFDGKYVAECYRSAKCRSYYGDINAYYIVRLVAFVFFPLLDYFVTVIYCFACDHSNSRRNFAGFRNDFPFDIPDARAHRRAHRCTELVNVGLQAFAIITMQVALQLFIYHGVYILLGFIASPIQVLSFGTLYVAGVFCVIVYSAVWLRFCSCRFTNRGDCLNRFWMNVLSPFLTGVLFLGFVGLIIAFIYRTILASEDYRNSGGVTTFITSLAPTALLGLIGYAGKRLLSLEHSSDTRDAARCDDGNEGYANIFVPLTTPRPTSEGARLLPRRASDPNSRMYESI